MCSEPIYLKSQHQHVPCGKCGNCLKRKISDWTIRLQVEHRYSIQSFFITLTYEKTTRDIVKVDLQNYIKRLRKILSGKRYSSNGSIVSLRYFALSDYGDTFGRPHFHLLVFVKGAPILDRYFFHTPWMGFEMVPQERIGGFVDAQPVTFGRIHYVVRYGMLAKLDFDKEEQRPRPRFFMSRRPALGSDWLSSEMVRWMQRGDRWYFPDGKYKKPLPRFYRDKIFSESRRRDHAYCVSVESDRRLRDQLNSISKYNSNPLKYYEECVKHESNQFLSQLRYQKKLKNKLL